MPPPVPLVLRAAEREYTRCGECLSAALCAVRAAHERGDLAEHARLLREAFPLVARAYAEARDGWVDARDAISRDPPPLVRVCPDCERLLLTDEWFAGRCGRCQQGNLSLPVAS